MGYFVVVKIFRCHYVWAFCCVNTNLILNVFVFWCCCSFMLVCTQLTHNLQYLLCSLTPSQNTNTPKTSTHCFSSLYIYICLFHAPLLLIAQKSCNVTSSIDHTSIFPDRYIRSCPNTNKKLFRFG